MQGQEIALPDRSANIGGALPDELPILYRDEWLVAVHKPARLPVHPRDPDRHATRFAVQMLRDRICQPVWPVHRLDRGTSGLVLFALDQDTLRLLSHQFEAGEVDKRYLAVVRGHPPESGRIDHPLTPLADSRAGLRLDKPPQSAVTLFRRLLTVELPYRVDRYPTSRYALLELHPVTGRRHQLRRHLKHIAHPVIGDTTHGKGRHNRLFQDLFGCHRLLLASVGLTLRHPMTGALLQLEAPLAADFWAVLGQLGWRGVANVD